MKNIFYKTVLTFTFVLLVLVSKSQTTLYVDSSVAISGNGTSWASPYKNLNQALNIANSGSGKYNVNLAQGTYFPTAVNGSIATSRDSSFIIFRKGISIFGGYPAGGGTRNSKQFVSRISGEIGSQSTVTDNVYHTLVFAINTNSSDSLILDGVTIEGGYANGSGSVSINSVNFSRNNGGGISSNNNSVTAIQDVYLTNCLIQNNYSSANGGGIQNFKCTLTILGSFFYNNKSDAWGGGINNELGGSLIFVNDIFSNNVCVANGGAVRVSGSSTNFIRNCTFVNNSVTSAGGAIRVAANGTATLNVYNSVFRGNRSGTDFTSTEADISNGRTLNVFSSNLQSSQPCTSCLVANTDPLLSNINSPLGNDGFFGTSDDGLILTSTSPAINVGNNTYISGYSTDITGAPRIQSSTVDLGAYEYGSLVSVVTLGSFGSLNSCGSPSGSYNTFQVSGSSLIADLVVNAPSNFEISSSPNSGYTTSLNFTPSSNVVTPKTIYVRLMSSASGINSGNITVASTGAPTQTLAVNGTVNILPTINVGTVSSVLTTATAFSLPYSATTGSPNQYSITTASPSLMSGFTIVNNATLGTSPINVAIPASAAATYNFNISVTNSTSGCISINNPFTVTVSTVPLITSTNNFTSFTTCAGNVSTEQLFTVRGQFLTADLVVTAPAGFEISQAVLGTGGAVIGSTGSYSNSITLTRTADNVPTTSLFIRLSTSAVSTTTAGNISCTTTGGTAINIPMAATILTRPAAPSISAGSSLSVCAGNSVALTSTLGSTNNVLAWFRNGVSINNTITTYTASIAGSYTTIETSSNGCASNSSIAAVFVVNAVPEATITQGSQLAFINCETTSVNLNANTGTGLTYQWRLNEVDINGANASTYAVKQAGNYTVRVSNSNNCSIESTVTNVVAVPSATVTGATNVCAGSTVSLTANATGFANPTYQWLKDGVVINNATAASFGATQTGSYSVRITSGTLVSFSCPISITVNPLPLVAIAAAPSNSVCVGTSAAFNANSATATSYQWFNGTSAIASATGLSLAITESGTYNVKVTDANGCVSTSDASSISVNALPIISEISGANQVKVGSNISLFNTTGGGVWSTNNSAIATINASTGLLNGISAGSVKVQYTVQNANGCSSFVSTTILVNSIGLKPTISANTTTSFCAGSSVILNSSAATFNQWYKDGVVIGGANGATYTATQTGVYTVASGLDQLLSDGIQVTVNPLPAATITQGAQLAFTDCASSFINITANTFTGAAYQWLNASGSILNATNQQYAVTTAGNYSVRITDANGCISTSSITKVAALPTASVTGSSIVCEGTPVSLSVDQIGYSSPAFQWKNAGVDVTGATSANFNPTVSGTYTVTVNDNTITSTSCPIAITVNPLPTGSIAASSTIAVCAGTPVTLTATPNNANAYQWFNTGNGIANAINNNYIANASGIYSARITDANGCFNTIGSTTVTINAIPIVGDIVGEQNICANTNTNFTNPTTGGLWSSSNTAVATVDQFGLVRGVSAGTATISYTVTTNNCPTTVTRTVTVTAGVSITTQPTASISQCVGTSASISVVATGNNLTYQWFKNGTVINGATTSIYSDNNLVASDAGNYTVVISSACGSVTSITSVWTVNTFPVVTIAGTQQLCFLSTTTFTSTTARGVWSSGNTTAATISAAGVITGRQEGVATITYTVTTPAGCVSTATRNITIHPLPIITATATPSLVYKGQNTQLGVAIVGNVPSTYAWSPAANITSPTQASTSARVLQNTTYTLTATSAQGCVASSNVSVTTRDEAFVEPVNVFTPNGDGINDRFVIKNLDAYPVNKLQVFDRTGKVIYEQNNYANTWDGYVNGKLLTKDTYFYILTVNGAVVKKATITLLR
ncbi:MAG: gliding motility-associated C-terminal domain-containing protein [Sediminibacterium sp.]|nr:gliding motility-associated C-terminal domain-containing protein [Sediminibacterium sp.]